MCDNDWDTLGIFSFYFIIIHCKVILFPFVAPQDNVFDLTEVTWSAAIKNVVGVVSQDNVPIAIAGELYQIYHCCPSLNLYHLSNSLRPIQQIMHLIDKLESYIVNNYVPICHFYYNVVYIWYSNIHILVCLYLYLLSYFQSVSQIYIR